MRLGGRFARSGGKIVLFTVQYIDLVSGVIINVIYIYIFFFCNFLLSNDNPATIDGSIAGLEELR